MGCIIIIKSCKRGKHSEKEEEMFGESHIVLSCLIQVILWIQSTIFKFINYDMTLKSSEKELSLLFLLMMRQESGCLNIAHRIFPHGISKSCLGYFLCFVFSPLIHLQSCTQIKDGWKIQLSISSVFWWPRLWTFW